MAHGWRGKAGFALALSVTLTLVACGSPPRAVWDKEGLTQDELRRDQKACVAEANDYGFLNSGFSVNSGNSASVATRQQADIYRACMAKKGYTEAPAGAQPKAGQSPQPPR